MPRNIRRAVTAGAVALGCVFAFGVADAAPAEATRPCSTINYNFGNAVLNRQQVTNISSPAALWMYQDHKRGSGAASVGRAVTGGVGMAYCGTTFYHSTSKL